MAIKENEFRKFAECFTLDEEATIDGIKINQACIAMQQTESVAVDRAKSLVSFIRSVYKQFNTTTIGTVVRAYRLRDKCINQRLIDNSNN